MQTLQSPLVNLLLLIFTFLFLIGTSLFAGLIRSFRTFQQKEMEKTFQSAEKRFFYRYIHHYFFPKKEIESLFFSIQFSLNMTRFLFVFFSTFVLLQTTFFLNFIDDLNFGLFNILNFCWIVGWFLLFVLLLFFIGDFLPRLIGKNYPEQTFNFCAPYASLFLVLFFPLNFLLLKITGLSSSNLYYNEIYESDLQAKKEIIEIVKESMFTDELQDTEKKLISSVLAFCQHLTREVMIPRVDLFSFNAETTIKEAATLIIEEGFSRVPIYEDSIDNIQGIVMYKDLLGKYIEFEQKGNDRSILDAPVSTIKKTAIYTPETKKISDLLQDFRKKQTHIAIVVDEYGGTEGIITIEDILEDIVGEIVDEYDEQEELYAPLPDGTWEVDARMSILDAEEQLGIEFPETGDYDTIGGYIFQCAGEIPNKGFTILTDEFEIEVLKSNDRVIEKVRIKPIPTDE